MSPVNSAVARLSPVIVFVGFKYLVVPVDPGNDVVVTVRTGAWQVESDRLIGAPAATGQAADTEHAAATAGNRQLGVSAVARAIGRKIEFHTEVSRCAGAEVVDLEMAER